MDVHIGSRANSVAQVRPVAPSAASGLAVLAAVIVLLPSAGVCAPSPQSFALASRASVRVAALSVLQSIQSQQLPNGHVRILLQFSGAAGARPMSVGPTANYLLSFVGSVAASTVPSIIPVNLGAVQSVSVALQGNALTVGIAMLSPVQPRISNGPGSLIIVDVPAAPYQAQNPLNYPLQQATPAPSGTTRTEIIRLHFADVSEIVGILTGQGGVAPGNVFNPQQNQIGAQQPGFSGTFGQQINTGQQFGQQFGQNFQPFQQFGQYQQPTFGASYTEQQALGQRISDNLAIDRRLNAIIITGTSEQIAQAVSLIQRLDIPVQSVLLDTEVVEVNETGAKAIGLDFDQTESQPITRIFNKQAQVINSIPSEAIAGAVALQSNIFALVSQGHARVLAAPKILTQDGLAASILTGDSLPIRVTTPVGVGGVGAVSSQVEYINVGVNLQILPRVTGNGGVDANVYSQVSSVTSINSSGDPQISTRQAQTKVNLMEGQTLVIGGLLQQRDIRNLQKIPILGDIPLLGALFRFYTETKQNTNLVITVTPHVIPAPAITPNGSGTPQAPAPY